MEARESKTVQIAAWQFSVLVGGLGLTSVIAVAAVIALVSVRTNESAAPTSSVVTAPPPRPRHLPGQFSAVRVGMPLEELVAAFPARGDVTSCRTQLVGGEPPRQRIPGEDEKGAHARCPDLMAVAGLSRDEEELLAAAAVEIDGANDDDELRGLVLSVAQVRSAVRSGVITEEQILAAASDRAGSARAAALHVAGQLYDGSVRFSAPRNARRPIGATLVAGCSDVDRDRTRSYFAGGYTLGQIDGEARTRIGPCLGTFTQREEELKTRFRSRLGGLAAIGLARASRPDRRLDPDDPASFTVFETRGRLGRPAAELGVRIANAIPDLERRLDGVVQLVPDDASVFRSALVWVEGGVVTRAEVTLASVEDVLGAVETAEKDLGPGRKDGAAISWTPEGGAMTRLDRGAGWVLAAWGEAAAPTKPSTEIRSVEPTPAPTAPPATTEEIPGQPAPVILALPSPPPENPPGGGTRTSSGSPSAPASRMSGGALDGTDPSPPGPPASPVADDVLGYGPSSP